MTNGVITKSKQIIKCPACKQKVEAIVSEYDIELDKRMVMNGGTTHAEPIIKHVKEVSGWCGVKAQRIKIGV